MKRYVYIGKIKPDKCHDRHSGCPDGCPGTIAKVCCFSGNELKLTINIKRGVEVITVGTDRFFAILYSLLCPSNPKGQDIPHDYVKCKAGNYECRHCGIHESIHECPCGWSGKRETGYTLFYICGSERVI